MHAHLLGNVWGTLTHPRLWLLAVTESREVERRLQFAAEPLCFEANRLGKLLLNLAKRQNDIDRKGQAGTEGDQLKRILKADPPGTAKMVVVSDENPSVHFYVEFYERPVLDGCECELGISRLSLCCKNRFLGYPGSGVVIVFEPQLKRSLSETADDTSLLSAILLGGFRESPNKPFGWSAMRGAFYPAAESLEEQQRTQREFQIITGTATFLTADGTIDGAASGMPAYVPGSSDFGSGTPEEILEAKKAVTQNMNAIVCALRQWITKYELENQEECVTAGPE